MLRPHRVDVVCGALLGGAFLAQSLAPKIGATFTFSARVPPTGPEGLFTATYRLPKGFIADVQGKRVAIVDDVMSAGSALRGTYNELRTHGVTPVVAGALLVLGDTGAAFFEQANIPVEAAARDAYDLWPPDACPLCAAGQPLELVAT